MSCVAAMSKRVNLDAGQPEVVQRGSPWYEKTFFLCAIHSVMFVIVYRKYLISSKFLFTDNYSRPVLTYTKIYLNKKKKDGKSIILFRRHFS